MKNLLDTHTFIWYINGEKEISEKAKKAIEHKNAVNFISIASIWEIAIKISLGKLEMKESFSKISEQIILNGFQILPITIEDTLYLSSLDFHHRDPFDRIIISQSIVNKLHIISKDTHFEKYTVEIIW